MGFDPKAYASSPVPQEFDPKAYAAAPAPSESQKPSKLKSFGEGLAETATFGYLPEIEATIYKMLPGDSGKSFGELRDEFAAVSKEAKEANPKSYIGGSIAGALGSGAMLSKVIPAARGLTIPERMMSAGKTGAAIGGLQATEQTEGQYDPIALGQRARGAGLGFLLGAGSQGLLEGGKVIAERAAPALKDYAAKKAFKTLGGTSTQVQKAQASGSDIEVGRALLDEKIVSPLATTGKIAQRLDSAKEEAGEAVSNLIKSVGDKKVVDAEKLAIEMSYTPELQQMRTTPGMESAAKQVDGFLETLAANKEMTLEEAQLLRRGIDKSINFNKRAPEMAGSQEQLYNIRTALRDRMNSVINELQGGAPKDALLKVNRRYGILADAEKQVDKTLSRQANNRSFGLTDTIAGAAGIASGGGVAASAGKAAVLGLINKGIRTFGTQMTAVGSDRLANALAKAPSIVELAGNNPTRLQSVLNGIGAVVSDRYEMKPGEVDTLIQNPQLLQIFKENPTLVDEIQDPKRRKLIQRAISKETSSQTPANGGALQRRLEKK